MNEVLQLLWLTTPPKGLLGPFLFCFELPFFLLQVKFKKDKPSHMIGPHFPWALSAMVTWTQSKLVRALAFFLGGNHTSSWSFKTEIRVKHLGSSQFGLDKPLLGPFLEARALALQVLDFCHFDRLPWSIFDATQAMNFFWASKKIQFIKKQAYKIARILSWGGVLFCAKKGA